ncbi:hypothetical protein ACPPVO_37175 [Dactylosporangium sp. McL0621]|uniref:hypothetical protein n=1 Tax=Dactylosporangium sp. McL0621 TaxID=3415678 RepID=UPI003CF763C1
MPSTASRRRIVAAVAAAATAVAGLGASAAPPRPLGGAAGWASSAWLGGSATGGGTTLAAVRGAINASTGAAAALTGSGVGVEDVGGRDVVRPPVERRVELDGPGLVGPLLVRALLVRALLVGPLPVQRRLVHRFLELTLAGPGRAAGVPAARLRSVRGPRRRRRGSRCAGSSSGCWRPWR